MEHLAVLLVGARRHIVKASVDDRPALAVHCRRQLPRRLDQRAVFFSVEPTVLHSFIY